MRTFILLLMLVCVCVSLAQDGSYIALLPYRIQPSGKIIIPVYFLKPISTGQTVTGVLMDYTNRTISTYTVSVDRNNPTTQIHINLDVPKNIKLGTHFVELTCKGDIQFFKRTSVNMYGYRERNVILVQTDKAVYKPGDKVQYRIIIANGDLTPISTPLDIDFRDPKGHKIDERNGENALNCLTGELQLADRPPLGSWKITVRAKKYAATKTYRFDVLEYVLPKFEVTLGLKQYALSEDNTDLTGNVKAFYTFGKPVKGTVILTLSARYGHSLFNVRGVQIKKEINGELDFAFKSVAIEHLSRYLGSRGSLRVDINVTETITGITLGVEKSVRYYSNPYKIEYFPHMPDHFNPGLGPYKGLVKVTMQDGSPSPVNPTKKLYITVTHFTESKVTSVVPNTVSVHNYKLISPFLNGDVIMKNTKEYSLQEDGNVKFDVEIPANVATFSIKAEFEKQKVYKDVKRFRARGDTRFKAELLSTVLKINDNADIKFTSNAPATVYFMVRVQHKTAASGEVQVRLDSNNKYTGTGSFVVTKDMVPSAKFVAFLYNPGDGEIYGDGLNFVVNNIFENKVTLSFNNATQTVLPASDIALHVNAAPGSFIGVLAVDKSVKLLKKGNDITQQRVKDELPRLGNFPILSKGWGIPFLWRMSADDTNDIFNNANLKLVTDAYVERFNIRRLRQSIIYRRRYYNSYGTSRFGRYYNSYGTSRYSPSALSSRHFGRSRIRTSPVGQVRKDFPETWLWKSMDSSSGSESITAKVPDTLTEFQANAFAIHPTAGLGVAEMTANLTVFKPFFVNLQIPYSIIRGETAVIQANVFNYRDTDEYVTVRLEGSPDFDSIAIDASGNEVQQSGNIEQCILVPSKQPTKVFFSIKPKVIKDVMLKVRASIPNVPFDEVQRPLPVKAEGIEMSKNIPLLFSVKNNTAGLKETKTIKYPAELVENSEQITVSVIGDLFGPSMRNLDKLIRIPYGCGEQNLVKFAPVVFTAKYIRDTKRNLDSDPELKKKIEEALKQGYQRQLLYQRNDGSFSAFGNADRSGSSWLTAFVVKSFAQAYTLNLAYFDVKVIDRAVKYIIDRSQAPNGSFSNVGVVNNKYLQGGSTANIRALTAYKTIALLEVQQSEILKNDATIAKLNGAIINATNFLRSTPPTHQPTDYERAITAYAFQLGGRDDSLVIRILAQLESSKSRQIISDNRKYWDLPYLSLEIELASYVMMTYAQRKDSQSGYMILNWIVDQRNPYGGFVSTQDTVVALQALSEFAVLVYVRDVNAEVTIFTTSTSGVTSQVQTVSLTSDNHDILHLRYFDGTDVASVIVSVTGNGLAMIDIGQTYNVKSEAPSNSYDMKVISKDETKHSYTLNVCASYIKSGDTTSNMAIINVGPISGFTPEMDRIQVDNVATSPRYVRIRRNELSNKRAILYFDEIPKTPGQVCVNIPFQKETLVAGAKAANVIIYSYYEPDEKESKHYLPTILATSNLCKTCGADCGCPSTIPSKTLPLKMCGAGQNVHLPVVPAEIPLLTPNY